jgi:hypothetical protein
MSKVQLPLPVGEGIPKLQVYDVCLTTNVVRQNSDYSDAAVSANLCATFGNDMASLVEIPNRFPITMFQ